MTHEKLPGTKYLQNVLKNPYSKSQDDRSKFVCRQRRFYWSYADPTGFDLLTAPSPTHLPLETSSPPLRIDRI